MNPSNRSVQESLESQAEMGQTLPHPVDEIVLLESKGFLVDLVTGAVSVDPDFVGDGELFPVRAYKVLADDVWVLVFRSTPKYNFPAHVGRSRARDGFGNAYSVIRYDPVECAGG